MGKGIRLPKKIKRFFSHYLLFICIVFIRSGHYTVKLIFCIIVFANIAKNMEIKKFISKIKNIIPYLYFRVYDSMYNTASDRNPNIRAFLLICVIKTSYVFTFLLMPINVIFFDSPFVFLLPFHIGFILASNNSEYERLRGMTHKWLFEEESERRVKLWYLIIFCAIPIVFYIPMIMISKQFSLVM